MSAITSTFVRDKKKKGAPGEEESWVGCLGGGVAKLCSIKLDLDSLTHWLVDRCPAWKSPQMSGLENLTDYAGP